MKKVILLLPILFLFQLLSAQNETIVIEKIDVSGNKRTKTNIILRELDVQIGDSVEVENLTKMIEQNRLLLISTGLFSLVQIEKKDSTANKISLDITVEESWYLYPFINVEVGDRDFNVWWTQKNRALNRLNYNFQVSHRNLTGRRDLLKSYVQFGYEPKFQISYNLPYFNKEQTLGLRGDIFYAQAKEWGLNTQNDTLSLISNQDSVMIRRLRLTAGLRYQQGVFSKHEAEIRFHRHQISEYAADYNPDFFLDGNTLQRYLALTYTFTTDYRDFKPFPLKGYFFSASLHKQGFGIFKDINTLYITPKFAYYQPLGKKFSAAFSVRGKVSLLRHQQPYYNSRAVGYRPNVMRGYEFFVVDGLDFVMARASLRYQWLDKGLTINKNKPDRQRQNFPLKIYSTVFHDEAFINNPYYSDSNEFSNRQLWSIGTGLNLLIYNDFLLRMEYTWNHEGNGGFYVHFDLPF